MNKDNLQKELLEKVKPGTKPSNIKKERQKQDKISNSPPPISINEDEGYWSGEEEKIMTEKEKEPIAEIEEELTEEPIFIQECGTDIGDDELPEPDFIEKEIEIDKEHDSDIIYCHEN